MKTWKIDSAHSEIGFKVKHLMISTVKGFFGEFEGTLEASDNTFSDVKISFSANTSSVNTKNTGRDEHLKSAEFFNSAEFPLITFTSTSVEAAGEKLKVTGDFTMKGTTQSINLDATVHGIGTGIDGKEVAVFEVTGSINRKDFGLNWNAALETGGVAVSDEVMFDIHIEASELSE